MALDEYGLGSTWLDEEEKRRKAALGIATPELRGGPTGGRGAARAKKLNLASEPSTYFDEQVNRVQRQKETALLSPLEDYYHLANRYGGQDKLAERIKRVSESWNVYMNPYSGKQTIWDLVKSPYTEEQIDAMLKTAQTVGYNFAPPGPNGLMVPKSYIKELGLDPDNKRDSSIAAVRWTMGGRARPLTAVGSPTDWKKVWAGFKVLGNVYLYTNPATYFTQVAAAAVKGFASTLGQHEGGTLGKTANALGAGISQGMNEAMGGGMADRNLAQLHYINEQKPTGLEPPAIPSELHQQMSTFKAYMVEQASEAEVKNVEKWLSEPIFDAYGNIVEPAATTEVVQDGVLSFEEQHAIDSRFAGAMRARKLAFAELQENHYISANDEYSDDLNDPVFALGMAKAQKDYAYFAELGRSHPLLGILLDETGLPITRVRLEKLYNGLSAEGLIGAGFAGLKGIAGATGGVMDFLPAAVLALLRADKDQNYQNALNKEVAYVRADMARKGATDARMLDLNQNPAAFSAQYIASELAEDPQAQDLNARRNVELQRVIHRYGFGGDLLTMGAYLSSPFSDLSQEQIENWAAKNVDLIAGTNIIGWMLLGKSERGKPSKVPRTVDGFKSEPLAARTIDFIIDHVNKEEVSAARIADLPLVEQLADAAMRGDAAPLQAAFGPRKVNMRLADDIVAQALKSQKAEITKPRTVQATARLEKAGFTTVEAEAMLVRGEHVTQAIERNLASRGIVRDTNPEATVAWKRDRTQAEPGKRFVTKRGQTLEASVDAFVKEWTDYVAKNTKADATRTIRMSIAEQLSEALLADTRRGQIGVGAHFVGGRDASAFMRHVDNVRLGKGSTFSSLAANAFVAVRQGLEMRLKAVLPYASDEALAAIRDYRVKVKDGAVVKEMVPTQAQLDRFIRNRQRLYSDVVDLRAYAHDMAAEWWSGGKDGSMMDVFPWLQERLVPNPSFVRQQMHDMVEGFPEGPLKVYAQRLNHTFSEVPMSEVMWSDPRYPDVIFNNALAATEDVAIAKKLMDKAVLARSKADFEAIQNTLDALASEHYVRDTRAGRQRSMSVRPSTGEPLGEFAVKTGGRSEMRTTVPETTMQRYTTTYDRGTLWARRNLDSAGIQRVADEIANLERQTARGLNAPSSLLRNFTVATGMKLPFKHLLTDSMRTGVELGVQSLARYKRRAAQLEEIVNSMPRELQDEFAVAFKRVEQTSAHYLHDFHASKDYHSIELQKNPRRSANALRRIATSDVFRAWAKGWDEGGAQSAVAGVRTYLESPKGMAFLKESGFLKTVREMETAEGRVTKGQALKDLAVETFIETHIMGRYTEIEMMAPKIAQAVREMANNGEVVTTTQLRKIIKQNKDENPFLPVEKTASGVDIRGAMMWWTGNVLMWANRANRKTAMTTLMLRTYKKLLKEGAQPERAFRIAETVAEFGTQRIHFDLARALVVEQRHRWFAWFMTKHRLYSTWLADIAIRYPGVAVAAKEISDWIDERFSDENTAPWDKGKINFEMGGKAYHWNVDASLWLQDFGQESDVGQLVKEGAALAVNMLPIGPKVEVRQSPFGYTGVPRAVPFIIGLSHWYNLRSIFDDERITSPEAQEQAVSDYLDSLKGDERERWSKAITIEQGYAMLSGEGPISFVEAVRRATAKNIGHQLLQIGSPVSLSLQGVEENAFNKAMRQLWEEKDPGKRNEMLRTNPALIYGLNLTRDPAEALQINEGRREYLAAREEMERAYDAAWLDGTIDDPDVLKTILNNYEIRTSRMLNENDKEHYNPGYAKYIAATDQKTALDELKYLYPLTDLSKLEADLNRPTGPESIAKEAELRAEFKKEVESRGWTKRDEDSLEYRQLRIEMVDEPLAEFNKEDLLPGMNRAESWAARALARGENGIFRRDQFMDAIQDKNKLDLWMKGLDSGQPQPSELLMATLTGDEKEYLGINVKAETENRWDVIRSMLRDLHEESLRTGKGSATKEYKAQRAEIDKIAEQFAQQDDQFAQEYYFSRLPLHERLMYIGVGDGKSKAEQGMGEFLSIVDEYYQELEQTHVKVKGRETARVGVGPEAGSAFDMTEPYIRRVQELKDSNPEWWRVFNRRFTLRSFGFNWMAPARTDLDVWREPDPLKVGE